MSKSNTNIDFVYFSKFAILVAPLSPWESFSFHKLIENVPHLTH